MGSALFHLIGNIGDRQMINLAIIPSMVLFFVVWYGDKVEKEPPKLLAKLFGLGCLSTISAVILGLLGEFAAGLVFEQESMIYLAVDNFILTALIEEGGKYFFLKVGTWKNKEFNYTFDGVVYAVAVSLGFATIENILYVLSSGLIGGFFVAIIRALLSVPGHVMFAVFMGYYYGLAKYAEAEGNMAKCRINLVKALLVPVLLHGFFDFCLSTGEGIFILLFFLFDICMTVAAVVRFWLFSKGDTAIPVVRRTDSGESERQDVQ